MKLVVGVDDGIILDLNRCVIIDDSALGEADRVLLNAGTEEQAISVATRLGVSLAGVLARTGFGDLSYTNSIAYSPIAIRQELEEKLEAVKETDEEVYEIMAWGLGLSDDSLDVVGQFIVNGTEEWEHYFTNIVMALQIIRDEMIVRESNETA